MSEDKNTKQEDVKMCVVAEPDDEWESKIDYFTLKRSVEEMERQRETQNAFLKSEQEEQRKFRNKCIIAILFGLMVLFGILAVAIPSADAFFQFLIGVIWIIFIGWFISWVKKQ